MALAGCGKKGDQKQASPSCPLIVRFALDSGQILGVSPALLGCPL
jgi:hypothetical protein